MMNPPQPGSPELKTEMVAANGLHFEVLMCGAGGRLALCLHGFPEVALSWREQMPVLAAMRYRVWAPNQRGYGRSSRPLGVQNYAVEHLMEDVAALIDASGLTEVVLLGHDWGALIAWMFAARRLRPLKRLVIINAPHPVCFARSLRKPEQMLRSWYVAAFQLPWLPEWLLARGHANAIENMMLYTSTSPRTFSEDVLKATRDNASTPGTLRAMIHWYRAFLRGGGLRRQLKQGFPVIDTPTMMIWGERDSFLAKHTTDGTADLVRSLEIRYLPGVSHWVQQDAPEACNDCLREFLNREYERP